MKGLKNLHIKIGTIGVCTLMFFLGLFCVILSSIKYESPFDWWSLWGQAAFNTAGTTLMASCVISYIMEISNINTLFSNILKNVLDDDFPLEAYSKENLENFKYRICVNECNPGMKKEQLLNGIYKYEKKLLELSNSIYYQYHKAKYVIEPNEKEGIFRVKAKIDYKIINKFGNENKMRFKIRTYSISDSEPKQDYENNFALSRFEVNGVPMTDFEPDIEAIHKDAGSNFYDYKVKINKDFGKQKETTIKMEYTYNVPMDDKIQSYKLTLPCKSMEHEIKMEEDKSTKEKWEIKTNAFTAFYYRQKDENAKFKVETIGNDFVKIRYDDWIIPGGGYVLVFNKK